MKISVGRRAFAVLVFAAGMMALCLMMAQPVHGAGNFIIKNYDVDVVVNEDDTYKVTETIDVEFTAASHGIYKTIPYLITLDRDGQRDTFYTKVKDFEMLTDQPCEEIKGDEAYMFKIGDKDRYADTDTRYKLRYTYDMRGDHLNGADEVYYNLIGTKWEAKSIDKVRFRITFPEAIDMKNVGIKTGDQENVDFQTEGDTVVKGTTDAFVMNGLTIRAVLPEGYFARQASGNNMPFYIVFGLMIAAMIWGIVMWRKHGMDPDVIETEEFYPPEGLSAPEVAYLEKEEIAGEQVTSMLLSLADKGYVRISEGALQELSEGALEEPEDAGKKKKKKNKKIDYRIYKVKDYDGENPLEDTFMRGLFPADARYDQKAGEVYVTKADLKNKFYTTVNDIKEEIEAIYTGQLYDEKAGQYAFLMGLVAVVLYFVMWLASKISNGSPFIVDGEAAVYLGLGAVQVLLPPLAFWFIGKRVMRGRKNPFGYLGYVILALLGIGIAALFNAFMGTQTVPYLVGSGICLALFVVGGLCERKTDYYAEMLGKIRGFKRFLQVAEKDRIDMLAEQDPGYYYKNLAFAFALGVTAVYAKRFAALAKQPPEWYSTPYYYYGASIFDPVGMTDSLSDAMHGFSNSMTSSPSDSGGGGGFSGGGGAGGGGGGSW